MAQSLAFILRDPLPPIRADVLTLFGTEMPRYGIEAALIGQGGGHAAAPGWRGGAQHAVGRSASRLASVMSPFWDAAGLVKAWRRGRPDALQVRDKIASGLLGRLVSAVTGVPFIYWMSFPIVEGFEVRRDDIGRHGRGLRWALHALRAAASRFVLYR
ncbi:MAG: hypothetical protein JF619_30425, partial [Massilia sp.]|nr:hypothetical protein [Massilia sp.]